jgi:hypothetical protein
MHAPASDTFEPLIGGNRAGKFKDEQEANEEDCGFHGNLSMWFYEHRKSLGHCL